ncbi:hypothetical protein ACFVYD_32640 [Streptomyces sp. NPDC058301]|uniref:hypothetical protein n=1 Tax=Streptomyces sp. NPDC058301 TaxID=3346436 RepID=UPI0036E0245A
MDRADERAGRLSLSTEEYDAVRAAVTSAASTWAGGQPLTFTSLFLRWRGVTARVEEGYSWCAAEVDNDIWCRSVLAEIWPLLPAGVQAVMGPELDIVDERYRRATVAWPGQSEDEGEWWHRRVPRRLEVEASELRDGDWPLGWEMMPFPKPDAVEVFS